MKSDQPPCIIYADLESLIKQIDGWANNPEKSSTTKLGEHIPLGYSMSTICELDNTENKHSLCHGEDCIKTFYIYPREHAANLINFGKKKMLPLTEKELKLHQDSRVCYICRKKFEQKVKIILKLGTTVISHVNIEVQHIVCVI